MPRPLDDVELRRRRDAGQAEQLGRRGADDAGRRVEGVLAEQDEVVAAVLQLRRERLRDRESVGGNAVGLEVHGTVGAHAHRLAQRLLHRVGTDGDDHRLAAAALLVDLQRGLDGVAGEVVDVELQARLVDRDARRRRS